MKKGFKFILAMLIVVLSASQALTQVNVNVQIRPPFTPFIADYINPAKLQDITVSVLNTSTSEVRVKFKFSLTNISKGISLSIKESSSPLKPYVLNPNEFRFVQLEDVSRLYGKITYTDFNVNGIDIQRAIADGTVPDGMYEFCIEAFDFDAPGFSRPLGGGRPQGCGVFQVIYPDPPSDIRLNNQLLNYSFGGNVPQVNRMGSGVQLYQVNFTPPVPSVGSQYQYELYVFDEQTLNPRMMSETQMLSAFEVLPPYIRKTSMSPVFMIDQSDLPLDENKNYYLFIKVSDLSNKTIFKNKGVSSIQAVRLSQSISEIREIIPPTIEVFNFKFVDIDSASNKARKFQVPKIFTQNLPALVEENSICGRDLINPVPSKQIKFNWPSGEEIPEDLLMHVKLRLKILRYTPGVIPPDDLFSATTGVVVLDTLYQDLNLSDWRNGIKIKGLKSEDVEIYHKRYAIGIKLILPQQFLASNRMRNDGLSTICTYVTGGSDKTIPTPTPQAPTEYSASVVYPLNGDTLPFRTDHVQIQSSRP